MLQSGRTIDGYRLIREIGKGGFGVVWLCRDPTEELRALKFIPHSQDHRLKRELKGLKTYRKKFGHAPPGLVTIEHVKLDKAGLSYVMPLAEGPPGIKPEDPAWKPVTLETRIESRRSTTWFSIEEIVAIFTPLAMAMQTLADAELAHRDVKPENVLFFEGQPRFVDVGLIAEDQPDLSRIGTFDYLAPQWYIDSKGKRDMWGLAAMLYHCATGNHPSYMSRADYDRPPHGMEKMSVGERVKWLLLNDISLRATAQEPTERYEQFSDIADALEFVLDYKIPPSASRHKAPRRQDELVWAIILLAGAAILFGLIFNHSLPHLNFDSLNPH